MAPQKKGDLNEDEEKLIESINEGLLLLYYVTQLADIDTINMFLQYWNQP